MSYKPLSEKEAKDLANPPLIEDGTYKFEVIEVHNKDKNNMYLVDKNKEPMSRIKIKVCDGENRERFVFTNLFWGAQNKMSFRTRHFADTLGVIDAYEDGSLLENLSITLGQQGHCEICTQKERPKNDGSNEVWAAKNDVRDFVIPKEDSLLAGENGFINDEISF